MPQPNLTGDTEDSRDDLLSNASDTAGNATSDGLDSNGTDEDVKVISYTEDVQTQPLGDTESVEKVVEDLAEVDGAMEPNQHEEEAKPMSAAVAQAVAELGDFTGEPQQGIATGTQVETVTEEVTTESVVSEPTQDEKTETGTTEVKKTEQTTIQEEPESHPKKGKGWLIGVIVAAIVFLGICGAAIWYFVYYSNPDKVAYDAIHNLITAENVSIDGGVVVSSDNAQAIIDFDTTGEHLPNSATVSALLTLQDGSDTASFKFNIGSIQMRNGVLYLQVDGILDSLKGMGIDEDDYNNEMLISYLEEFEGEWWEISVPDIVDMLDLGEFGDFINDSYVCVVDSMNADDSNELAELYSKNRFVKVEPVKKIVHGSGTEEPEAGYRFYEVSIDRNALVGFSNGLNDTKAVKDLNSCWNHVGQEYFGDDFSMSIDEVTIDDIELPEDMDIYLEISQFDHKLRSIRGVQGADEDIIPLSYSLLFKYDSAVEVSAPSSYRPITELIEEILTDMYYGDLEMDDYYPDDFDFDLDSVTVEV